MSFGFSIGDFLLIADLARKTALGCRHAPADFSEAGKAAESLHAILLSCDTEVKRPESVFQRDPQHVQKFNDLLHNCKSPLDRLDHILAKHASLRTDSPKLIDRFRIPRKDLLDIRGLLVLHVSYLTGFLNTVGLSSNGRVETGIYRLQDSSARVERAANRLIDNDANLARDTARLKSEIHHLKQDGQRVDGRLGVIMTSSVNLQQSARRLETGNVSLRGATQRIEHGNQRIEHRLQGLHGLQADISNIRFALIETVDKLGAQTRYQRPGGSVLSDHSSDDKEVWRRLRTELQDEGFTSRDVLKNEGIIRARLRELIQLGLWESELSSSPSSIADAVDHVEQTPPLPNNYKPPDVMTVTDDYGADKTVFILSSDHEAEDLALTPEKTCVFIVESNGTIHTSDLSNSLQVSVANTSLAKLTQSGTSRRPSSLAKHRALKGQRTYPAVAWVYRRSGRRFLSGRKSLNSSTRTLEDTKLIDAARSGYIDEVERLLKRGYCTEARGPDAAVDNAAERTALYYAVCKNYFDVAHLLLMYGANPNVYGTDSISALQEAVHNRDVNMARLLLEYGAKPDAHERTKKTTALLTAATCGSVKLTQLLLEYEAGIDKPDAKGLTPLFMAAWKGKTKVVELLLREGARLNRKDKPELSELYKAAGQGHAEVVELLLKYGARPDDGRGACGETPIYKAARAGHEAVVRLLLAWGAEPDVENETRSGMGGSMADKFIWLLRPLEAPRDEYKERPLHAAAHNGYLEIVRLLLDAGADVHAKRAGGQTALYAAASRGHKAVVEVLLSRGAELEDQRVVDPVARLMTEQELSGIDGPGTLQLDDHLGNLAQSYRRVAASQGGDGLKAMRQIYGTDRARALEEKLKTTVLDDIVASLLGKNGGLMPLDHVIKEALSSLTGGINEASVRRRIEDKGEGEGMGMG